MFSSSRLLIVKRAKDMNENKRGDWCLLGSLLAVPSLLSTHRCVWAVSQTWTPLMECNVLDVFICDKPFIHRNTNAILRIKAAS